MEGFEHYQPRTHLSISSLMNFSRCPRRFFYQSGCRLQKGEEHAALKYGSGIHAALPHLLSGDEKTRMNRAIAAFRKIFDEEYDNSIADKKRNLSRAKAMLYDFWSSHSHTNSLYSLESPPKTGVKMEDGTSDWEIPFAIDIGIGVPLVGRIDALVRHRDTKALWALEWKTSSELSDRFLNSFENSPQACCYTLALKLYTNEHIEGTMVEGLRVSHVNAENMIRPISIPDFKINNFVKWARFQGAMLLKMEQMQDFHQDYSGCTPYAMFGMPGYVCDYRDLCNVGDWTTLKGFYAVSADRPFILGEGALKTSSTPGRFSLPVVQEAT